MSESGVRLKTGSEPAARGVRFLPPTFEAWEGEGENSASAREGVGVGVAVLMSGGVDSSVTALLLKERGWNVVGVTMKIPVAEQCDHPRPCCGGQAALVCRSLGLPHYFMDVAEAFEREVIDPFRRAYSEGRTPSPCVDCNTFLKFGAVWDLIEETLGVRYVATGHYARVLDGAGGEKEEEGMPHRWSYLLARGRAASRDQSYFLYGVPRERLGRLLFPLGEMEKDEIRALARRRGLEAAESRDSMELCFAGEGDYRRALGETGLGRPGPIVDREGNEIGRHRGIRHYTMGQRRGLGVGGGDPLYVLAVDPRRNTIVAGARELAERTRVRADRVNVLHPESYRAGTRLFGKIRSTGEPEPCELTEADPDRMEVRFDAPVFAPAPGQHLVLYDSADCVVCGGTMEGDDGE